MKLNIYFFVAGYLYCMLVSFIMNYKRKEKKREE